jgi:hypothetical protein
MEEIQETALSGRYWRVMILITKNSLRDPRRKKQFVAGVCQSMHEFLTSDVPISIEMKAGVSLSDAAEALRSISEMLDTAGSVTKGDEDFDPADAWKHTD